MDIDKNLNNFNDRKKLITPEEEKQVQLQNCLAEQTLMIRCECFETLAERKAFCEGVNCPWQVYTNMLVDHKYLLTKFRRMNYPAKIKFITSIGLPHHILSIPAITPSPSPSLLTKKEPNL